MWHIIFLSERMEMFMKGEGTPQEGDMCQIGLTPKTLFETQYDTRKIEPVTMKASFIHF